MFCYHFVHVNNLLELAPSSPALGAGGWWDISDISSELREARGRVGLSQRELAKRAGISAPYVAMLEAGNRVPSRSVERRLALALGLPASHFSKESATVKPSEAVPVGADGRPLEGTTIDGGSVAFSEALPSLAILAGDVGVLGSVDWKAGALAVVRWPGGAGDRVVRLVEQGGMQFLGLLDTQDLVLLTSAHTVRGVLTRIERHLTM